jgi:hypothetical protein
MKFELGKTVITANAKNVLNMPCVNKALNRYIFGDWGDVCDEDARTNDVAVKNGERILGSYTDKFKQKFWIMTEADRSYTTVLMPEDY